MFEEGEELLIRPGDVLADRYLLVDLLSESGSGRFWRALDRTLDRHVSVHVIAADDERAPGLMEAARRSVTIPDRRILRVLDVDEHDGLCFVVNEWGSGTSLDILVGREGPVGPRRAAWIVSEVAASLAHAHEAGVAHGRLVPENVLIDQTGAVRVIGLSVEAALLGLPEGRITSDVTDLAALVYFLLTATWPGVSRSGCPAAPQEQGRVLRPRQVKAGVPRVLDTLCDEVINSGRSATGPSSSNGTVSAALIRDQLRDFVGDTVGLAAAEAAATSSIPHPPWTPAPVEPVPAASPRPVADEEPPEARAVEGDPPAPADTDESGTGSEDDDGEHTVVSPVMDQPTQAGMPIFDDESEDVSWLAKRAEVPPPPPPFEEPPERPLFAPTPPEGEPVRRSRPGAAAPPGGYWPWDTGPGAASGSGVIPVTEDEDDAVPGRNWLRLAGVIAASLLLLLAIVFAFNLGRGRTPLGGTDEPDSSASGATESPTTAPLEVADVTDLDPQGDPPEENPDLTSLVIDGAPATSWRTETYLQDLGPTGLKTGVGLVLDLGQVVDVSEVELTLVGQPTDVTLYLAERPPTGVAGLTSLSTTTARQREQITLDTPATGRYLVVWLTSLPPVEGGYRGEVADVVVRG